MDIFKATISYVSKDETAKENTLKTRMTEGSKTRILDEINDVIKEQCVNSVTVCISRSTHV